MPVIIPHDLPATEILEKEFISVMHEERARTQDIRPLRIGLLNLMPKKNCHRNAVYAPHWQYTFAN